jgi:hypothetical protein
MAMPAGRVALVVRGKKSTSHEPGVLEQHADCILPDGSPIGFYGTGNDQSGNAIGLRMNGEVWDFPLLSTRRVMYVDFDSAVGYGAISTTLFVQVTPAQSAAFVSAWSTMKTSPGSFNIVGDNCSTHASKAFMDAGILTDGIPGLDTPDNLYKQLVAQLPGKTMPMSGYIGFVARSGGGFDIKYRPYIMPTTGPVTADRSWSSF